MIEDKGTGLVLPATDACVWAKAIGELLDDPEKRQRMSEAAVRRMARFSLKSTFDQFWERHLREANDTTGEHVFSLAQPLAQKA